MTITLSTEEFGTFASNLSKWYNDCLVYVLTEGFTGRCYGGIDPRDEAYGARRIEELRVRYEKEHPKPDWRKLL